MGKPLWSSGNWKKIKFTWVILFPECNDECKYKLNKAWYLNHYWLTHWGRVTHIYVGKLTIIGSDNGLSPEWRFNKKDIEQVNQYKCLGVIVRSISRNNEDIFAYHYPYLCDQGRKALFGVLHRLRSITPIPPRVQFKLFDAVIKPILVYGSDVWGHNKSGISMIDKVMLRFSRCVLNVKATTSNVMVYGECGVLPPSVYCTVSTCVIWIVSIICPMIALWDKYTMSCSNYTRWDSNHGLLGLVNWLIHIPSILMIHQQNSNLNVNGLFSVNLRMRGVKMFKIFKEILSWEHIVKLNRNLVWKLIWN